MNFSWIFPVLSFLEAAFRALSRMDDKPGLSKDDFRAVVAKVRQLSTTDLSGHEKANRVASWISDHFGDMLSQRDWTSHLLTFVAYLWSKRKGIV